jgi:hypothetical protein
VKIRVRNGAKVLAIRRLVSGRTRRHEQSAGILTVTVLSVNGHEVVAIDL